VSWPGAYSSISRRNLFIRLWRLRFPRFIALNLLDDLSEQPAEQAKPAVGNAREFRDLDRSQSQQEEPEDHKKQIYGNHAPSVSPPEKQIRRPPKEPPAFPRYKVAALIWHRQIVYCFAGVLTSFSSSIPDTESMDSIAARKSASKEFAGLSLASSALMSAPSTTRGAKNVWPSLIQARM
jgi:hypothetical protein